MRRREKLGGVRDRIKTESEGGERRDRGLECERKSGSGLREGERESEQVQREGVKVEREIYSRERLGWGRKTEYVE